MSTPLDGQIDNVLNEMNTAGVTSDEYPKLLNNLERLSEIKKKIYRDPVSRDTIVLVAGNLLGILLIVAYEQKHVMTSRGLTQIRPPR